MSTTPDSGYIEVKYEQYLFQIRVISEEEVSLEVIDTKTLQVFSTDSHLFKSKVNASTLVATLNKQQEEFLKLKISIGQDDVQNLYLKLTLMVTYSFIPNFEEQIILPLKKDVNKEDMIKTQFKLINSEIKELGDCFEVQKQRQFGAKYVSVVSSGYYSQSTVTITTLTVPKGKYEINLSFYTQGTCSYLYLTLHSSCGQDVLKLPEQIYYFTEANASYYQPHIFRSIVDIKNDSSTITLCSPYSDSYPWHMKNLILSATAI